MPIITVTPSQPARLSGAFGRSTTFANAGPGVVTISYGEPAQTQTLASGASVSLVSPNGLFMLSTVDSQAVVTVTVAAPEAPLLGQVEVEPGDVPILTQSPSLASQLAYDANGNLEYTGDATPGTATSAAAWRISKLAYDTNGNLTSVKYAAAGAFTQVWDDRTSLTYA